MKTTGKFLFAIPMAIFGMMHFMMAAKMAGMVPSYIPGGIFWVYLTGLALIAAAAAIMMNKMVKTAGLLLGLLLMVFVLTIHLPMVMSGDEMKMAMAMPNMLKDVALSGAAIYIGMNSNP